MKKVIVVIAALLIICAILGICVFVALKITSPQTLDNISAGLGLKKEDPACIAGEGQQRYVHDNYNFCLVMPSAWTAKDADEQQVLISPDKGDGKIIFQAFNDDQFRDLVDIDDKFCQSFGEGFRSALNADETTVNQFQFSVFDLNGNKGCKAEGSLFEGVSQRYYVFFNKAKQNVYTIFYTENGGPEKELLQKSMDSFDIIGN